MYTLTWHLRPSYSIGGCAYRWMTYREPLPNGSSGEPGRGGEQVGRGMYRRAFEGDITHTPPAPFEFASFKTQRLGTPSLDDDDDDDVVDDDDVDDDDVDDFSSSSSSPQDKCVAQKCINSALLQTWYVSMMESAPPLSSIGTDNRDRDHLSSTRGWFGMWRLHRTGETEGRFSR